MLLTVGISLYATRLVLNALGDSDYGVFNLVAGVIAMLSFLSNTMATSTQRFLSYYQGKEDIPSQKKIFATSFFLHLIMASAIMLLLFLSSGFFFNGFLNIPPDRLIAAKGLFYFMIVSVFFTIIAVPFYGTLIAHENMLFVAIVNILEVLLRVIAAFALYHVSIDRLLAYGAFMAAIPLLSFIMYAVYCVRKYKECKISYEYYNRDMFKQLSSFASWNLFGSLASMGRLQGTAVLFNLFLGTIVNAAYGIANQVSSQVNFFSSTLIRALDPQIMKSEGAHDRQRTLGLSLIACKFGFFLIAVVAIPCIVEMDGILTFWLKNVPAYTVVFCQLILIGMMINQLSIGLQSAIQAVGRVKLYQIVVSIILLCNLPFAYILLKLNCSPNLVLVLYCVIELFASFWKLLFLKLTVSLSINSYLKRVFLPTLLPCLISLGVAICCRNYISINFRFIITLACSGLLFMLTAYAVGLDTEERTRVNTLLSNLLKNIKI